MLDVMWEPKAVETCRKEREGANQIRYRTADRLSNAIAVLDETWQGPFGGVESVARKVLTKHHNDLAFHWLRAAVQCGRDDFDIETLTDVIEEIDIALNKAKFKQLQDAIELLPLDLLSPEVLVTVLRASSPARNEFPKWSAIVDRVLRSLDERGLDGHGALAGLL
jgi:hypothetical protein